MNEMYRTNPIVRHNLTVILPDCMYKIRNIHAMTTTTNGIVDDYEDDGLSAQNNKKLDILDQVKQFLKNNGNIAEMAALETNQQQILQQLAELKKQMSNIKKQLKINNTIVGSCPVPVRPKIKYPNLILNVDPKHLPYSLELAQKLFEKEIHLIVQSHLHSTISSLNGECLEFASTLENFIPTSQNVATLKIKLIWKIGDDLEFLVSHLPLLGEANLMRFLFRLLPNNHLNYEKYQRVYEFDNLLDISYLITRSKTKTERSALLNNLNKSLGKSEWLVGQSQIGITDLVAFSAIKQNVSTNEINVNLGKWMQRCEKFRK